MKIKGEELKQILNGKLPDFEYNSIDLSVNFNLTDSQLNNLINFFMYTINPTEDIPLLK